MSADTGRYEVWFVPTEKGRKAFGWTESRYGGPGSSSLEDARLDAYIANQDDPAPDAREYGKYVVRRVAPEAP